LTESRAPITGSDSVEATADLDIILDMPTFPLLSPLMSIDDSGQFSDVDSPTHEHGRDPEVRQREQIHMTSSSKPSKPHHRRPGGDDRPSHFSHRDDRRRGNVARDESVEPSPKRASLHSRRPLADYNLISHGGDRDKPRDRSYGFGGRNSYHRSGYSHRR